MSALALVVALLLPAVQQDRTRVSAQLSNEAVRVGEAVTLVITVETASNADIAIKPPALANSLVVTGSQESTQMHFSIPGGRRRIVTRELILQPVTQGRFTIPAIEIDVGGTVYRTRPLALRVSAGAVTSPTMPRDEAWLRVNMNPDTVYVGQQTTLTAEAGFSEEVRVRLTRPPIFEMPAPTGFWVQEIPGDVRTELRQVEGRVVEVLVKKVAYFPLTAGRYALKPARAIVDVRQGFLFAPETREIRSVSPRVTVLPLPDAGKPEHFRGAVGQFTMETTIEPRTVAAGEPVQIKIVINGSGNIKAIAPPGLPQILGAEVFAPTEESTTEVNREVVAGSKTFTYVVIPEVEGVLHIPEINFSFFDPMQRAYRVLRNDPVEIQFAPGAEAGGETRNSYTLRPLRGRESPERLQWLSWPVFGALMLLPLLAAAGLLAWRRRKPRINRRAEYLARVRDAARLDDASVYRELDRILRDALSVPEAHTREVRDRDIRDRIVRLLARIEAARFAPSPPPSHERAAIVAATERAIKDLFGKCSARAAAPLVLFLAVSQNTFSSGIQAYESGDYKGAASAFAQHVQAAPRDASAWFNLGNAEFRSGDKGRAIAAWATALQIQPRSGDAAHNLRISGGAEALRVRPPLAVTHAEWLFLAVLLWWTAAIFVILALARGRRASSCVLLPALLAVVCLAIGFAATRVPQYAVALDDQTPLQAEPTVRSPLVRNVRAGAVLTVHESRDEWLRIQTIDERDAWVARDDVAIIGNAKANETIP
jgi:tetratricopeptide (TPR) repeat protein